MNIITKIKNLPRQEQLAYLAIAAGAVLILIATLLW